MYLNTEQARFNRSLMHSKQKHVSEKECLTSRSKAVPKLYFKNVVSFKIGAKFDALELVLKTKTI